jgi:predicted house-cleaning NTP pyrophosphatase (Maf/HAM1 superfamily)
MNFCWTVLLLIVITINLSACKIEEIENVIKPTVDEKAQQKAATAVIRRLIQEKADSVAIKVNFLLPVNYFSVSVIKCESHV